MRVPRKYFRKIEAILYEYREMVEELKRCLDDLYYSGLSSSVISVSGTCLYSNPVLRAVVERSENKKIKALSERICAIEKALQRLGDLDREIFFLRYVQCLPKEDILKKVGMSNSTFYEHLHRIVYAAGIELGVIDAVDVLED